jgi:ribosomal-protein-alanine N-acetyltransferase
MLQYCTVEDAIMPDYIRLMFREDIDQVSEIEREAFPTEWPPPNFKREIENRLAYYIVACNVAKLPEEEASPAQNGLTRLIPGLRKLGSQNRLADSKHLVGGQEYIKGFAGFWIMAEEAHITSIGTRQAFRRQGIGELLLQAVIDMAIRRKARIVTLEVRASNTLAQRLYTKYGFNHVGLRHGYYTNDREDAIIMSTDNIASPAFQAQLKELKKAYAEKWGPDHYHLVS